MIILVLLGSSCAEPQGLNSSVILVSIDTLRADHLGCYGYHRPTSPFIDSLAEGGVLFERAVVQIPGTLPSHMAMLTGLLPAEHDVFPPDDVLSEEIPLLAEIAASAGVRTAGFTEGGYVSGRYGFSRGFESFDDSHRGLNSDFEDTLGRALDFLRSIRTGERFFLFVHTYAVHDPYLPPLPYASQYTGSAVPGASVGTTPEASHLGDRSPARTAERTRFHREAVSFAESILPPGAPLPTGPNLSGFNRGRVEIPREAVPVYEALYDGTINYVDDLLRVFVERLEELGLSDSTVLVITSDHGEEFLEHGRLVHEQVYDECLHVPLIVSGPGVASGVRIDSPVMAVDLTPTVLELLGVSTAARFSGRSLARAMHSGAGTELDNSDAHAMAFVDPVESLYRRIGDRTYQLVAHSPQLLESEPWVENTIDLFPASPVVTFEALSFHRPRQVDVSINGHPSMTLELTPEWRQFEITLPGEEGSRHTVTLAARDCDSPAALGASPDERCLAFRLRGFESRRTELFDLSLDSSGTQDISGQRADVVETMFLGLESFHRSPIAVSQRVPMDKETEDQLKALGYLQ